MQRSLYFAPRKTDSSSSRRVNATVIYEPDWSRLCPVGLPNARVHRIARIGEPSTSAPVTTGAVVITALAHLNEAPSLLGRSLDASADRCPAGCT
jgi:hypothetical protein